METLDPITDEQLPGLLAALAEAARADQRTAARFVAPRVGILEETASRRHQFVLGRRGVGKSTLLRKIESLGQASESAVVFVDVETLRNRPYPDVLIEMLIELLSGLEERLQPDAWYRLDQRVSRMQVRRRLRKLTETLRRLLAQPQVAQHTVRELQSQASRGSVGIGIRLRHRGVGAAADVEAEKTSESATAAEGTEERTKMDGLLTAAVLIRNVLASAHDALGDKPTLIVLDDFYHVPFNDQPDVLAYLHQVVKNLDIFLKVCGVRHRLQPFVEGDPPRGMQVGQDAAELSLDITLERFEAAQGFLEEVLSGICEPLGVSLRLSETS
jgi:energy-coupling factor transporter ATP-binding protein EcfA2